MAQRELSIFKPMGELSESIGIERWVWGYGMDGVPLVNGVVGRLSSTGRRHRHDRHLGFWIGGCSTPTVVRAERTTRYLLNMTIEITSDHRLGYWLFGTPRCKIARHQEQSRESIGLLGVSPCWRFVLRDLSPCTPTLPFWVGQFHDHDTAARRHWKTLSS